MDKLKLRPEYLMGVDDGPEYNDRDAKFWEGVRKLSNGFLLFVYGLFAGYFWAMKAFGVGLFGGK